MAGKPSPIVEEARQRWQRCEEAEDEQRKAILLAKEFRAGNQWPDEIKIQRQGGSAIQGQAAQPPRPCLTIDRLSQPVRQISNQIKSANFAIDVLPNGNGADSETADIYKGILRRIQNQARGESPIEWAADQAIEGGIGWFRLRTDYVYHAVDGVQGPELFDQELKIERILNNLTVYCDPSSVKPTRSDARFMFVTEDLPREEFRRRFKDADYASLDEFSATGDMAQWVTDDIVRIAEYWRVVDEEQTVYVKADGTIQTGGDEPKDVLKQRVVKTPVVRMSLINAVEELEQSEWVGSHIPLIPILGEELNVDGKALLRGIITEGMDAQRMVNYMYSAAIETVALAPKAPLIVAEGQLEGYAGIWQNANRFNYSYLPYKPVSLNGTPVPPPVRDQTEPAIQAMVLMLAKSEEAIKATTGIWDPSLGNSNPREKSGRAIQALQGQSELGSSNYPDNVRRALIYAGEQMVEILPKITRPGQVMTILGVDDEPEQVILGQPYQEQNGKAVPMPDVSPEQVKMQKGLAKFFDLKQGTYSVAVQVGKSYTTRREEGAAALGELIPHLPPPMAAAVTPEFIEQLSFPGAHKIAETARRALPPELQPPADGEEQIPPKAQQAIQQLQMQLQATTKLAQELHETVQTDQVKSQAKLQERMLTEQAENERTLAKIRADQEVKMAEIATKNRELEIKLEIEMAKLGSAQMMARGEQEAQLLHQHNEAALRQQEMGAEQAESDMDRQNARDVKTAEIGLKAREGEEGRRLQREEGDKSRAFEAEQAERGRIAEQQMAREQAQRPQA
jgi:portal protein